MLKKCRVNWIRCWKIAHLAMVVLPIIGVGIASERRKSYIVCLIGSVGAVWFCIPSRPSKPAGNLTFLTSPPLWFPAWLGHPATYQLDHYWEKGGVTTRFTALELHYLPLNHGFLTNGPLWCLALLWCASFALPYHAGLPLPLLPSLLGSQTGWQVRQ